MAGQLCDDSTVTIEVHDSGRWRQPPADPADRGRGLLLMRECMDDVRIRKHADGTLVRLVRTVRGTQIAPTTAPPPVTDMPTGLHVYLEATEDGMRAVLTGDLDSAGTPGAALALRRATRGGTLPLEVDLTGLDHLASTGVRLLFDLAEEHHVNGTRLGVRLAYGSAAHHVLTLTGFHELAHVNIRVDPPST